ncbi:MAG: tRNA (adenosine(37)-N6)-dimethylallyltransferase MiaA [Clostridium sp.]|jgi:tRNA dimethylallyltransferase|nr:tRNA (adenosine(37)-N6)-dimethylallyltransferase MiaA [Clostridium sp.]
MTSGEDRFLKKPLVVLAGPTAVGKTGLSVALAKRINAEIVSADSMQVYRRMDIGSAKISPEEMQGVAHHLIDILEPWEDFNVTLFQQKCKETLPGIYARGHIPLLTGGTGFYIQALLYDIDFTQKKEDTRYRVFLDALAREKGPEYLYRLLAEADPQAAESIHANNLKRVKRALEFHHLTGERISAHNDRERRKASAYRSCYFVLHDRREKLYGQIERRVEGMLQKGLVEEVRGLREAGCRRGQVSMQGLGYKEILRYLDGELSLEEAAELIKKNTRHFAKRQLTWFRREKDTVWIDKSLFLYDDEKILDFMVRQLIERGLVQETGSYQDGVVSDGLPQNKLPQKTDRQERNHTDGRADRSPYRWPDEPFYG